MVEDLLNYLCILCFSSLSINIWLDLHFCEQKYFFPLNLIYQLSCININHFNLSVNILFCIDLSPPKVRGHVEKFWLLNYVKCLLSYQWLWWSQPCKWFDYPTLYLSGLLLVATSILVEGNNKLWSLLVFWSKKKPIKIGYKHFFTEYFWYGRSINKECLHQYTLLRCDDMRWFWVFFWEIFHVHML